MLSARNLSPQDSSAQSLSNTQLADHFVNHYPAHDFVISASEAMTLGLPVKALGEYIWAEEANALFQRYRDGGFDNGQHDHVLGVWNEDQIADIFSDESDTGEDDGDDEAEEGRG